MLSFRSTMVSSEPRTESNPGAPGVRADSTDPGGVVECSQGCSAAKPLVHHAPKTLQAPAGATERTLRVDAPARRTLAFSEF